jgi:eukaryotic-like serine/threonine-protein kinase
VQLPTDTGIVRELGSIANCGAPSDATGSQRISRIACDKPARMSHDVLNPRTRRDAAVMVDPIRAKSVFVAAVEKSPAERTAFLDEAVGEDTALRQRVEALIQAHDDPDSFLDKVGVQLPTVGHTPLAPLAERVGTLIGPYKLLQQIGEGGMGVVWMAEQTQPVQRKVALKVIKPGMDSRQVIARFEAERQALAMMDHVNIARVLDAGTTESGLPYFVMELVHGVPITQYCDDNHLTPRERLELFVPVCQAIQHAHQKGIIHRDIKPSNVMITLYDGKPVPKVIDFGVAKATEHRLTERTLFTQYGTMVGTLEYMSPEQAEMSTLGVDTRSDIFSLGVLLYELLTGSTPLTRKRLKEAAYGEILRMIREEEPPKPSTRLSDSGEAMASISAQRHMEPVKLTKLVRGELDWIVMKTLEKDRNRRYETASDFAADVQRYLADEPVQACPPTRTYRLTKFIRRNKAGVLAGSAVAAALITGLILAAFGFLQARREANRADHEAEVARAQEAGAKNQEEIARTQSKRSDEVARFLKEMLNAPRPWASVGQDTALLRSILDNAAVRIGNELKEQPEVAAELSGVIAFTYWSIGEFKESEAVYEQAIQHYAGRFGRENPRIANLLLNKSQPLRDQLKYAEAEATLREALAIARKGSVGETPEMAWMLRDLGLVLMLANKNPEEAESVERAALAIRRKVLGNQHKDVADSLVQMTQVLPADRSAEAEADARDAVAILKSLKTGGTLLPGALYKLAIILQHEDRLPEAEEAARESVALIQKAVGKDSPWGLRMLFRLTVVLNKEHKYDDLDALFDENPIPNTGNSGNRCDLLLCRAGRLLSHEKFSDAERDYRQALAIRVSTLGKDNPSTTAALNALIKALQAQDKPVDAEKLLLEADAIARNTNLEVVLPEE